MAGIRDHRLYEYTVTFEVQRMESTAYMEMDYAHDARGQRIWDQHTDTIRVIAPQFIPEIALAYVQNRFKPLHGYRNVQISEPKVTEINAFIEEKAY